MQLDAPKGADHSGYQQIIRPSLEMRAGLKSLSASEPVVGKHGSKRPTNVRLRLAGMWTGGRAPGKCGPIPMFPADSHVDSHLVATIDVRGRPLGPDRDRDDIHLKGEASRFRWLRARATTEIASRPVPLAAPAMYPTASGTTPSCYRNLAELTVMWMTLTRSISAAIRGGHKDRDPTIRKSPGEAYAG